MGCSNVGNQTIDPIITYCASVGLLNWSIRVCISSSPDFCTTTDHGPRTTAMCHCVLAIARSNCQRPIHHGPSPMICMASIPGSTYTYILIDSFGKYAARPPTNPGHFPRLGRCILVGKSPVSPASPVCGLPTLSHILESVTPSLSFGDAKWQWYGIFCCLDIFWPGPRHAQPNILGSYKYVQIQILVMYWGRDFQFISRMGFLTGEYRVQGDMLIKLR